MSELNERIRAARAHAQKTQQDIAAACGTTRSAVAQWESDNPASRTSPTIKNLMELSRTTGAPVGWLTSDATDPARHWEAPPQEPTEEASGGQAARQELRPENFGEQPKEAAR